jgi:photosystem I reaction center PsaK
MVASTTAFLVAGRFGVAPTSTRSTTTGLKLVDNKTAGLFSGDPSGVCKLEGEKGGVNLRNIISIF